VLFIPNPLLWRELGANTPLLYCTVGVLADSTGLCISPLPEEISGNKQSTTAAGVLADNTGLFFPLLLRRELGTSIQCIWTVHCMSTGRNTGLMHYHFPLRRDLKPTLPFFIAACWQIM
jgi:hypothetical protein